MKQKYFLRVGSDDLNDVEEHSTKSDAVASYAEAAQQLDGLGQELHGSIHIAESRRDIAEYPDYFLSLGPRGGVRCARV
jgi:hypothetical protein